MKLEHTCQACGADTRSDVSRLGKIDTCTHCTSEIEVPDAELGPGFIVGDFRIVSRLGSGGQSDVYLAMQQSMQREVALKILKPQALLDTTQAARFQREVQMAGKLDHPNIVSALASGEDDGVHYLAMQLVKGLPLSDWATQRGGLSESEVLLIGIKMADALHTAHEQLDMIHRDIKPSNMMIDEAGQVRLLDLGLAAAKTEIGAITQATMAPGTPLYMSPEHMLGEEMDQRSDIYSLGRSLMELLLGTRPSPEPGLKGLEDKDLTAATRNLLERMTAQSPDDRYPDWRSLQIDLLEALKRTGAQTDSDVVLAPLPVKPKKKIEAHSNRRGLWMLGGALTLGLLLGDRLLRQPPTRLLPATPTTTDAEEMKLDLGKGVTLRLKKIASGRAFLGAKPEEPGFAADEAQRSVRMRQHYWIGMTEVREVEYRQVMQTDHPVAQSELPVTRVSWDEAQVFCDQLNALSLNRPAGYAFRLPTENEWEFALRSGEGPAKSRSYSWGDEPALRHANMMAGYTHKGAPKGSVQSVGSYAPGPHGLLDMHGNVAEWCVDWYGPIDNADQPGLYGIARVVRGGSWMSTADQTRTAARGREFPTVKRPDVGFRLVLGPELPWLELSLDSSPPPQRQVKALEDFPGFPPGENFVLPLGDGVSAEMVAIPAGHFFMAAGSHLDSSNRMHEVQMHIEKPFWISAHEIDQEVYAIVRRQHPVKPLGVNYPMFGINWKAANFFAMQISQLYKKQLPASYEFRLPTEAEWEYACRAGSTNAYCFGNDKDQLIHYGNFCDRSCWVTHHRWIDGDDGFVETSPVGVFLPNDWGLYDMHGNITEWTLDGFKERSWNIPPDYRFVGKNWDLDYYVTRGGNWSLPREHCTSYFRISVDHWTSNNLVGIRLVLGPEVEHHRKKQLPDEWLEELENRPNAFY